MITIQMQNGMLDVGTEQYINLQVTNFRFSGGLRDTFTNDISIPKTPNNIHILNCYNLLDSPNQLYGERIMPAVLTVDGYMMNCYIQVVSVNSTTIDICLYELVIPNELRDKPIRDIIRDDDTTIYEWVARTKEHYPNEFKWYDYGSRYYNVYAQLHPVKPANTVLGKLSEITGYSMPSTDNDLMLMAQNKYVCPENKRQMICAALVSNSATMVMVGGQHIVNDMEGWDGHTKIQESSATTLSFNRDCSGTFKAYISWGRKLNSGTNTYQVSLIKNNNFIIGWTISTSSLGRRNGIIVSAEQPISLNKGDRLFFRLDSPTTSNPQDKFDLIEVIVDFVWDNYEIHPDDYGQELVYCNHHPNLLSWTSGNDTENHLFDGFSSTFKIYNWNGTVNQNESFQLILPWRGYSYFGYFCNLSDITVGEFLYSLCWYNGYGVENTIDGGVQFVDRDRHKVIDGEITSISPTSTYIARKNYIVWNGQETDKLYPVIEINSEWLEDQKILFESDFSLIDQNAIGRAKINQYTIKYDSDGKASVDFHEIDGQVAVRIQTEENIQTHEKLELIPPHEMSDLDFSLIKASTEVEIETFDDRISGNDFLYVDGRKFMVVQTNTDIINKKTTITALLVPTV